MAIRAIAAASLAKGASDIRNPASCDDALAALAVIRGLGAEVEIASDQWRIAGGGEPRGTVLDCGESGLAMRLFTAIAGLRDEQVVLTGHGSLASRPMGMIEGPLRKLGARVETTQGFLPVRIQGPIRSGRITVDGSMGSQLVSGLLFALPLCEGDSEVTVENPRSGPYLDLSVEVLGRFGIEIRRNRSPWGFEIPGGQAYRPESYEVEGDWSGASFLLAAGAMAGKVEVSGLRLDSGQADRMMIEALRMAGARVHEGEGKVLVERDQLRGFEIDVTDAPDLFPPLASLACSCQGETVLHGLGRLRHKESDRGAALAMELGRMGARVEPCGDALCIQGGPLQGADVGSHDDHRIAMACAVAALVAKNETRILGGECVSKSYPGFFDDLARLGGEIS